MSVECIASAVPRRESEVIPPLGPPVQPGFVSQLAQAYEESPFDSVQVGQTATSVDAVVLAQAVLAATDRLTVVVTMPPTVVDPVTATRAVASLAAMHPGRVRARIPFATDHPARHAELAHVLRGLRHSPAPLECVGPHFAVRHEWLAVRPDPAPQLYLHAGEHVLADQAVAAQADTCIVPAGSPPEVATRIRRMKELIGHRSLRFGIDVRPLVGVDDDTVEALSRSVIGVAPTWTLGNERESSRHDRRRVFAAMTRAHGSADPFVGTVEVIARRLYEYRIAGVDVFHRRGFDPLADVITHGAVVDVVRGLADADSQRSAVVHDVA